MVSKKQFANKVWAILCLISMLLIPMAEPAVPSKALAPSLSYLSILPAWATTERYDPPRPEGGLYRIYYNSQAELDSLASNFDIWEVKPEVKSAVIALSARDAASLMAQGYRLELDTEQEAISPLGPDGYPCYRDVDELYGRLQQIVTDYPDLTTLNSYGTSWRWQNVAPAEGYELKVLRITNRQIDTQKPILFLMADIHARELTTAEVALYFIEYLLDNYNTDADATWTVDHHEIYVIVTVNPDGRQFVEGGCLHRKNRNDDTSEDCTPCSEWVHYGIDLNRNYPYHWGGASDYVCNPMYQGPLAASEPETYYLIDLINSIIPDQRVDDDISAAPDDTTGLLVSLHSYGNLVLWPWAWSHSGAPNASQLQTLGRKLAYFSNYTPQQFSDMYTATGNTTDWAYGELGIPAYVFEMGEAFFQPCDDLDEIIDENLEALLYASKVPRTPYVTPSGPDVLDLIVTPITVSVGAAAHLTTTIDDTRYNNSNGTESTQTITGAEFYIDTPPWITTTTPVSYSMSVADGSFDETIEVVTATVDTTDLSGGRHTLFIRGQDTDGNWGAFSAAFLWVDRPITLTTIEITPTPLTITVGTTRTITATGYDQYGDPISITPTWATNGGTVPPSASATIVYTAQTTSARGLTITATQGDVFGTAEVNIIHGDARAIEVTPASATTTAGESVGYTVIARDIYGNAWDIGTQAAYTITPEAGGIWVNQVYTTEVAGTWGVAATYLGLTDTAVLTVTHAPTATSASLSPAQHTVEAGEQVVYTLVATDAHGNSWDASLDANYTITTAAAGVWTGNIYTAEIAGTWAVMAIHSGITKTATLIVTHSPLAIGVSLTPAQHRAEAGSQAIYTLTATDTYGNPWDVTASGNYTVTPSAGGMWMNNVYTPEVAGTWIITATILGLSDTATLTITHAPTAHYASLSPNSHKVGAHGQVVYTLIASDAYGNSWDATASGSYTITPAAGGSWIDNVYTSLNIGTWTVTGTVPDATASAVLTVTESPASSYTRVPAGRVCIGTSVQFTDTTLGDPTAWTWDFGDGSSSNLQHPVHTYSHSGTFTVTLTTTNTYGSDVAVNSVEVITGPSVTVTHTAGQNACPMTDVYFSSINSGSPATYLWNFGDSVTATGKHVSHLYRTPGTYTIWLTATNCCGDSVVSTTIRVGSVPSASFERDPMGDVLIDTPIHFTDTSSDDLTTWRWDFGDGIITYVQHPIHIYTTAGTFTTTLTVTGTCGSDTVTDTITVLPNCKSAHIAGLTSDSPVNQGQTMHFTATVTGTLPITYAWDFGDTTSPVTEAGLVTVSHIYPSGGIFTARLTVSNGCGVDDQNLPVTVNTGSEFWSLHLPLVMRDQSLRLSPDPISVTLRTGAARQKTIRLRSSAYVITTVAKQR